MKVIRHNESNEARFPKLKKVAYGNLYLTDRGLVFVKKGDGNYIRYRFQEIRGRSSEKSNIFQIVPDDGHLERFKMNKESCLKWEVYFDCIANSIYRSYKESK